MSDARRPPTDVPAQYAPTERSRVRRIPRRASYDRAVVHAILDEGLVAHVGFTVAGDPFVIPMVYARLGENLILHGAAASRLLGQGASGMRLCATVTLIDGLVLARSAFHHSMNYRSVVVHGTAQLLDGDEKRRALDAIVDHVLQGRAQAARPANDKELNATKVLALPIVEATAKVRSGGPIDDAEDLGWPVWAGVVPLALRAGEPIDDALCAPTTAAPAMLRGYDRSRLRG